MSHTDQRQGASIRRPASRIFASFIFFAVLICSVVLGGCAASQEEAQAPPQPPAFDLEGHRGARGLRPENSIPSFRRALELGVTTIELDVAVSKDSQVVVSHEPWFSAAICSLPSGEPVPEDRAKELRIYEMTYEEVAQYDCGSRGHPNFPRQQAMPTRKPLLGEVIQMAEQYVKTHERPPVWYNVEIKSNPEWDGVLTPEPEPFVRLVYEVLAEQDVVARSYIQSFDLRPLRVVHRLYPSLRVALLVGQGDEQTFAENIEQLGFTPDIYSPDYHLVDSALVEAVHARDMRLIPWTVNTLEAMKRLKVLGVDGLITDYPDLGRKLLQESG